MKQLLLFWLFLPLIASAQLTLTVTSIPANTPPGATIYVAGSFNSWSAGDPNFDLTPVAGGSYSITLNPPVGTVEFKFTRGSWATVEGNAQGQYRPNRTFQYSGAPTTLTLSILSWEGAGANSTAASNVQVLDDDFYMPQLNRYRRIWVYLPPDYYTSSKTYPVLYMHDGQNLFDNATSAFGEWEVDESLNTLFQQGDYGAIVVGIDNGATERLNEYSPWINAQYGGGQGDEYMAFITQTLKPHIDSTFRTRPGRDFTAMLGSSMGGLISMYGAVDRQDVFSKAGILSPAFWFAGNNSANQIATEGMDAPLRVYFLAGGQEPASVTTNMQAVANALIQAGFAVDQQTTLVPPDGTHSEWFWKREFPAAYQWLFAGLLSNTGEPAQTSNLYVYPNPADDFVKVAGLAPGTSCRIRIVDANGRQWRRRTVRAGDSVPIGQLPPGLYVAYLRTDGKAEQARRFVVSR